MWLKSWVLLLFLTVWTKPRLTKLTVGRWHPTNSKYEPPAGSARCFIAGNLQMSTSLVSYVSRTVPPERTCRQPVMRRCTLGNLLHSTTQMKELRHKVRAWQARGRFDPDNNEDLYCLTPLWNMHKNVPCGPFVIRGTTGLQRKIRATCGFLSCRTGLSNIRHEGQNWPGENSNPAHWTNLENMKEEINLGLLTRFYNFSYSTMAIHFTPM